jgi:hypothetical protein
MHSARLIHPHERCLGTGVSPRYQSNADGSLELIAPGDPYRADDGMLGLASFLAHHPDDFDLMLDTGCFDLTAGSIPLRAFCSLRGRRSGFGNPNGERPMHTGSHVRFARNGLSVGRLTRPGVDDRVSLITIEHLGLYQDPALRRRSAPGDDPEGIAIWLDAPSDQTTLNHVNVSCCHVGIRSDSYIDSLRVRGFHVGDVTHPILFHAPTEPPGGYTANWFNSFTDCIWADGDGPAVVLGNAIDCPWNFTNVHVIRQGRSAGVWPEQCNVYWTVSQGRWSGGSIFDPGTLLRTNDGRHRREPRTIDADGMVLGGSDNVIATAFRGARGRGRANLRLLPGANRNFIWSQFLGTHDQALDLIIPEGCSDNVVIEHPGMTIVDHGTNTRRITGITRPPYAEPSP